MEKRVFFILLVSLVFSMSLASAEIFVSQPQSSYALGDSVNFDVTITPSANSVNFLSVKIVCPNGEVEIYKNQVSVQVNQEKTTNIEAVLSRNFVSNLEGQCNFKAEFGDETFSTQAFTLSSNLEIQFYLAKPSYLPGEQVSFEGIVTRVTGDQASGFIEVTLANLQVLVKKQFSEGKFYVNFTVPSNAPAGTYTVNVYAYERDSSNSITNSANKTSSLSVPQVLNSLSLSFSSDQLVPGNPLTYSVKALDQSGQEMPADFDISIYSPDDKLLTKEKVSSGQSKSLETKKSDKSGYWRIEASSSGISGKKLFYLSELEEAEFILENSTLMVTNTGNIPYTKEINVKIGEQVVTIANKSIPVGQSKKFDVSAPDGEYEVSILDSAGLFNLGRTFLTGRVISIDEIGSGLRLPKIALWLILVLFAGLILGYVYVRGRRTHSPLAGIEIKNPFRRKSEGLKKAQMPVMLSSDSVTNGQKELASFLVLKSSNSNQQVDKAVSIARQAGAHTYKDGNYHVMVFSPSKTKMQENELLAAKTATVIKQDLDNYNRKFKDTVDYGLALSSGQIISDSSTSKYNFVMRDTALSASKKLSSTAKSEILFNETVRAKLLSGAKTQKVENGVWKLISVSDKDKYKDFLKGFSERLSRE